MTGCERFKEDVCFISAHDPRRATSCGARRPSREPGEPGGDTWGDLPLLFRAGADSWIPGSYDPESNLTYWSTVAGEAVGQGVARHRRRRALQQQRARPRRRHRRAVLVLPVHAGRDPRPRRRVRERAHRPRRAPVALQDGEARHFVGARPRHRRVRRRPRSRLPGRARRRPGDGEGGLPAREAPGEGRRARVLPRLRGHPELARVRLSPRDEGSLHPHPPDLRQRRFHRDRAGARREVLPEHGLAVARQHRPSRQRALPGPPHRDGDRDRAHPVAPLDDDPAGGAQR